MAEHSPCSGPANRDAVYGRKRFARCGAVFASVLILASVAFAQTASTRMAVSVTVARACSVRSSAVTGGVTLACSNGVPNVALAAGARSSIRPLVGGINTLPVDSSDQPLVVTLNF